jgi:hypothetical protein
MKRILVVLCVLILMSAGVAIAQLSVDIDIKPGSDPNNINLECNGVIEVAILTMDDFDAMTVDPSSVRFGPDSATEVHGEGHIDDVDDDGDLDVVLHFNTQETGIECGDVEAWLTGETFDGQAIEGFDSVSTECDSSSVSGDIGCNGAVIDDLCIDGNIMVYTSCTITRSTIDNNIKSEEGGDLIFEYSTINGNIESGGGDVTLEDSSINGDIKSGGGDVAVIDYSTVKGNIESGGGDVTVSDSTVEGNIICDYGTVTLSGDYMIYGNIDKCN